MDDSHFPSVKRTSATENEDLFVEAYGNHNLSSGVWSDVRKIRQDDNKLVQVCAQAHKCLAKFDGVVAAAVYDQRMLYFDDNETYVPMQIDILLYALKDVHTEEAPNFFYICKGLREPCVHYLMPNDTEAFFLKLGEHVCGIDMEKI